MKLRSRSWTKANKEFQIFIISYNFLYSLFSCFLFWFIYLFVFLLSPTIFSLYFFFLFPYYNFLSIFSICFLIILSLTIFYSVLSLYTLVFFSIESRFIQVTDLEVEYKIIILYETSVLQTSRFWLWSILIPQSSRSLYMFDHFP